MVVVVASVYVVAYVYVYVNVSVSVVFAASSTSVLVEVAVFLCYPCYCITKEGQMGSTFQLHYTLIFSLINVKQTQLESRESHLSSEKIDPTYL